MVNTEGTEVREPEERQLLRARAIAQAPDGMTLRDAVTFHALDAAHLPGDAEMTRGITTLAENVVALAKAPKGEDYSGPVLFEGMAGAQIFAEVLGSNLALTRRPVGDGGRGGGAHGQRTRRPHRRARPPGVVRRGGRSDAEGMARPRAVRQLSKWIAKASRPSRCGWSKRAC